MYKKINVALIIFIPIIVSFAFVLSTILLYDYYNTEMLFLLFLIFAILICAYYLICTYRIQSTINSLSGRIEKSPGLVIFLFFITLGIYRIYWIWYAHNRCVELSRRYDRLSGGIYIVLVLFTSGIGSFICICKLLFRYNNLVDMANIPTNETGLDLL